MAELDVFRGRVASVVATERWVIDGNYSKVRDLVWGRAEDVVWLAGLLVPGDVRAFVAPDDRPRAQRRRTLEWESRALPRRSGRETRSSYGRSRATDGIAARFPPLLASERYGHLLVVRLRTPRAAETSKPLRARRGYRSVAR
jgi:hypothetical protein